MRSGVHFTSSTDFLERFWRPVRVTSTGCWERTERGYASFALWVGGTVYVTTRATHIAWELENALPFPRGMFACHHCDNPPCVNPDHLFVGTAKDNAMDAKRKGRLTNTRKVGAPPPAPIVHVPVPHPEPDDGSFVAGKYRWRFTEPARPQRTASDIRVVFTKPIPVPRPIPPHREAARQRELAKLNR